jgi:hypothetical protein
MDWQGKVFQQAFAWALGANVIRRGAGNMEVTCLQSDLSVNADAMCSARAQRLHTRPAVRHNFEQHGARRPAAAICSNSGSFVRVQAAPLVVDVAGADVAAHVAAPLVADVALPPHA